MDPSSFKMGLKAASVLNIYIIKTNQLFPGLYSKESAEHVQQLLQKNEVPPNLFELYVEEIFSYLRGNIFKRFIDSDKFTRDDLFQSSWPTVVLQENINIFIAIPRLN